MDDPKVTASPLILKEQMKAVLDNPETCAEHRQEILDMSRQLTAKLESSLEARYNIACSVSSTPLSFFFQYHFVMTDCYSLCNWL